MHFELRLQGGGKLFAYGLVWADTILAFGIARIREVPSFCRDDDYANFFTEHAKSFWAFWRMGEVARTHLLDRRNLCNAVTWAEQTRGAGFISIDRNAGSVDVEVCLSDREADDGSSALEEWVGIVQHAKDDLNQEVLLRLNLAESALRDLDIDGFKAGKRLGTTDIELEVRRSAIQFASDD
jgi:hypothetical protein